MLKEKYDWSADTLFRIGGHGNICTKCEEHSNIRNVYTLKQSYTTISHVWGLISRKS